MNSFDVFDTLLARRYITSDPIFKKIENEINVPSFADKRKLADSGSRSIYQIYDELVANGTIHQNMKDSLIKREIELEIAHAIPVQKNINKVEHGDILISDMYLPANAILQMARSVGLDKQVTLYQSNGDKSNGSVWKKFNESPSYHLGDNRHSDFISPRNNGINGEWFNPATELNDIEHKIFNSGMLHIALLCREIRLLNDNDDKFFNISNSLNLPLLFILSELVNRHTNKNIVFLGRDCQQLQKLFSEYYGLCYYLPFSRMVAYNQPEDAIHYLKTHSPENSLYFDLSSTGGTWEKLNGDIDISVAIYSDLSFYTSKKPVPPKNFNWIAKNSTIGQTNLMIEVLNCGDHGHLDSIKIHKDKLMQSSFAEPELPTKVIENIHKPVYDAISLSSNYKNGIRSELSKFSDDDLIKNFGLLAMAICNRHDLLIEIEGFLSKENAYVNAFHNK